MRETGKALGVWLLGLCGIAAAAGAVAEPWKTLPSPPSLPTPLRSGFAPVNGVRLFYAEFGHGSPVLLLHGGFANSNYWSPIIPSLVRAHHEVVVIDSRGHGRSTRDAKPYSYERMAADVISVLDYLKLPTVDLVGWSDGGIIGLEIAMHHPQRLRRLYAYGANADPSGVSDPSENPTFRRYLEQTRDEYRTLSATPQDYDRFAEQIDAMWAEQPRFTSDELRRITVPTAIADGAHEEAIKPQHTEYLARTIPGAKLIILPDVSHFGMLQSPQEFAESVLEFLQAP